MKVLLTGAAGFIGGYVVEELLARGHEVVGLDDFSKYGPVSRSYDDDARYRFIEGDARDPELVYELLDGCEHFIAAAAMVGGIAYYHAFAYDLLASNARITAAACDAAIRRRREGSLRKLTYISSSMTYESTRSWPSYEGQQLEIPPPRSPYGFGQLAVEYFARSAFAQHGLPFTIVRPFNGVGVGERRALAQVETRSGNLMLALSHVVPDLVRKVLSGQDPLHLMGDGRQSRCYTYAGDIARGIVTAMAHPDATNEDFNLSSPRATSVLELAAAIWRRVHGAATPFRVVYDTALPHDVSRQLAATEKAKRVLGFEATTGLEAMLDEVIPWMEGAIACGAV